MGGWESNHTNVKSISSCSYYRVPVSETQRTSFIFEYIHWIKLLQSYERKQHMNNLKIWLNPEQLKTIHLQNSTEVEEGRDSIIGVWYVLHYSVATCTPSPVWGEIRHTPIKPCRPMTHNTASCLYFLENFHQIHKHNFYQISYIWGFHFSGIWCHING